MVRGLSMATADVLSSGCLCHCKDIAACSGVHVLSSRAVRAAAFAVALPTARFRGRRRPLLLPGCRAERAGAAAAGLLQKTGMPPFTLTWAFEFFAGVFMAFNPAEYFQQLVAQGYAC